MKKIVKLLLILIGFIPLICNAQVEKEVNYKWYTLIEDNIHYESEAEEVCEYFDKSNYITSDWHYSLEKPEEKEYRTIKRELGDIHIGRDYFNTLKISELNIDNSNKANIYELEFLDKNNNALNTILTNFQLEGNVNNILDNNPNTFTTILSTNKLTFEFTEPINIKDFKIRISYKDEGINLNGINFSILLNNEIELNILSNAESIIETTCNNGVCIQEIVLKDNIYNKDKILGTMMYLYQDKYYKCYELKKIYVPGYYNNLEGFIKDEENYIEITKEISIEQNNNINNLPEIIENTLEEVKEDLVNEPQEENNLEDELNYNIKDTFLSKPIAMVTKEDNNTKNESTTPYIIALIALLLISLIVIIARKVVKSRTK